LSNPVNATLVGSGSTNMTIQNDDREPGISIEDASIVEGNSGTKTLNVKVSTDRLSSDNVQVNYTTIDGTAISSGILDYGASSGTLTFSPKTNSATIPI